MIDIKIKRIYEEASKSDGYRVLVDRIWPRGVSKEDAKLDQWMKEIAPSTELRKWFNHKEDRFDAFSKKYRKELNDHSDLIKELLNKTKNRHLTLLYSAKDETHNQAVVLKSFIENK